MKTNYKKIESLTEERNNLLDKFRNSFNKDEYKEISSRIKEIETEIKNLKLIDKVNLINHENKIKKDLISEFLNVGIIDPKFITNDGKLNKNLEKQNPLLYQLTNKHEARFGWDYDGNVLIRIYKERKTYEFTLSYVDYTVKKEDRVKTLFEDLQNACKGNRTLFEDLKISVVKKQLANINKATEKFKQQEEEYNKELQRNNSYFFESENFLSVSSSRTNLLSY